MAVVCGWCNHLLDNSGPEALEDDAPQQAPRAVAVNHWYYGVIDTIESWLNWLHDIHPLLWHIAYDLKACAVWFVLYRIRAFIFNVPSNLYWLFFCAVHKAARRLRSGRDGLT